MCSSDLAQFVDEASTKSTYGLPQNTQDFQPTYPNPIVPTNNENSQQQIPYSNESSVPLNVRTDLYLGRSFPLFHGTMTKDLGIPCPLSIRQEQVLPHLSRCALAPTLVQGHSEFDAFTLTNWSDAQRQANLMSHF